ncbi:DNA excision repair protein ERCC-1 [Grifola frondosa]|uniref:DNA excision repair protein ERCC-1 n=1 Tax=Grifola frondosa TaxID=5627 RepID=A0A1C7LVX6_GRIFR|nr:DNA excision repair protein ERCC-1 [Grifola frondosa]
MSSAASGSGSQNITPNVTKPPVVQPGSGNNIIVNPCQRGNPILDCIRNVGKEFGEIVADYQVGRTTGVLFLSLRYHRLHPEYIHQRIERLGHSYNLRILLLMCDVSEHQEPIRELTKICLINNITVMVAWNVEEAGFYLSTFKQFEHKPPDLIKERVDRDYYSILRTALTSISKVNKTDVETLRTSFGSFSDIARASSEQLQNLPGFGQVKAKRIQDAFEKPFRNNVTSALPFSARTQDKRSRGKEKEIDTQSPSQPATVASSGKPRPPRPPSPVWDIELDLNNSPSPTSETGPPPHRSPSINAGNMGAQPHASSPLWDIELDLNDSQSEEDENKEKRKGDSFGKPTIFTEL